MILWALIIAYIFPSALPKTFKLAIKLLKRMDTTKPLTPLLFETIIKQIAAPLAPLKILHTSPTTSEHIELTLSAFFISFIAILLILLLEYDFIKKGLMSLAVTATPIISNKTLTPTKLSIKMVAKIMFACDNINSEIMPKKTHTKSENKNNSRYQILNFLVCIFDFIFKVCASISVVLSSLLCFFISFTYYYIHNMRRKALD